MVNLNIVGAIQPLEDLHYFLIRLYDNVVILKYYILISLTHFCASELRNKLPEA